MNFRVGDGYSIILMSQARTAPYRDRIEDDGATLIYEGHDEPRKAGQSDPKRIDQPATTNRGSPTENGKFSEAAQRYLQGESPPERVRVYEKIRAGIWSYNGLFHLIDSWIENDGQRQVFKFKLVAAEDNTLNAGLNTSDLESSRLIPSAVKVAVWQRDNGRCVTCGATDNLHFDHIIPYSKGGTSLRAENIQILCARHNLAKQNRIQ
jgi:hypothetical protein